MARHKLKAAKREVLGKHVKGLRRSGLTPANLYGHGRESQALQIETPTLQRALARVGRTTLLDLQVDKDAPRVVLVKQVQVHPVYQRLLHVDFYLVDMSQKMKVEVPLTFTGEAPALGIPGALLITAMNSIAVECLPGDLPSRLEVDINGLKEINDSVYVRDLALGQGVTALAEPDQVVVKIGLARVTEEAAPAAEAPEEGAPEGEAPSEEAPAAEKA